MFRSIFAEGFSDAVATPILSEHHKDKEKIFIIGNHLLCFISISLFLFTLLGIFFSKYLVMIFAPGYISNISKFNLAVSFTRITFVYLLLIGISSIITSMLYALKKFFIPAINPVFLNVTFIPGILLFSGFFKNYILVVCVVIAGILEVIFPFVALRREGFLLNLNLKNSLKDPLVNKMLKLFLPRVWSSIIYHLNVFLDTILASLTYIVGEGALAAIYYANRLIQFPFALIALSIAPVVIVDFSSYHKEGNLTDFKKLFVFSFQNIIFFIIPISFVFIFLPEGIIDILFRRGEFNVSSLRVTSGVLFFYSFGLFFYCAIKILVTSFYSLKDTVTPAKTATLSLAVNAISSAILMFPLKIGGVALGTTLAAVVNFFLLYRALIKKIGKMDWEDTKAQLVKVIFLSAVMGLSCRFLWNVLLYGKYVKMLIVATLGLFIFIVGGFALRLRHVYYIKEWISKKR
jgi:putative peptidoglycan lipid II flippase